MSSTERMATDEAGSSACLVSSREDIMGDNAEK